MTNIKDIITLSVQIIYDLSELVFPTGQANDRMDIVHNRMDNKN